MRTLKTLMEFAVPMATITAFVAAAGAALAIMVAQPSRASVRTVVPASAKIPVAAKPSPVQVL